MEAASNQYLVRLDKVDRSCLTAFGFFEAQVRIHFSVVAGEQELMRILLRTCRAHLDGPESTCTKVYREARSKLKAILRKIFEEGMASGEAAKF